MASKGTSAVAVLFVGAGAWLAYAGINDVPLVEGLRTLLGGEAPTGRAKALAVAQRPPKTGGSLSGGEALAPTGNIVTAPDTTIRVDASIANGVSRLVEAARMAGITLTGGGYRTRAEQAALRFRNGCPDLTSSSSTCRTPTAPVGQSMHEKGLAIDFSANGQLIRSRDSVGFRFLAQHAASAGLHNLPSEPWHWSTNGK